MKFWEYNRNKVIFIAVLSFAGGLLLLMLLSGSDRLLMGRALIFAGISSFFATSVYAFRGLSYFRVMKRIMDDTSEKSIHPLFDDGYTIVLNNEANSVFFTTERLKGDIGGLPVLVAFSQGSRASWPSLIFSFYPLAHSSLGNRTSRYLSFKMGLRNRLKKDVKPEVLQFVADLKGKGYSSAEYSQYFVTAN